MSSKCAICEMDIQVGEPMLSDERMNLAHLSCIQKVVPIPPPVPPSPPSPLVAAPDSCVPTSSVKFCSVCGKPCIAMCPAPCLQYVHQDFGYNGGIACSIVHEGKCEVARKSREPSPKPLAIKPGLLFDTVEFPTKNANGRRKTKPVRKPRVRR